MMRAATDQERELILADRIVMHQDCSESFHEHLKERFQKGISLMHLEDVEIIPICCSTINKHICVEELHKKPGSFFLIMDEHHLDLMHSLDYLFFAFGTNDYKRAIWNLVLEHMPHHQKRLKSTVNHVLAEQYLLEWQVRKASNCMDEMDKNPLEAEDFTGDIGEFEADYLFLKLRRLDQMQPYILTFYVFHELAHIVFQKKREQLNPFISIYDDMPDILKNRAVQDLASYGDDKVGFPYEDMICDTYAQSLLFDMAYEHNQEFDYEYLVDSYVCAVLNLTILDSIFRHDSGSDAWYVTCWIRIILVLNMVGTFLAQKYSEHEILRKIQRRMNYCRILFENSKEHILEEIYRARADANEIEEDKQPGTQEWKEIFDDVLDRIRALQ